MRSAKEKESIISSRNDTKKIKGSSAHVLNVDGKHFFAIDTKNRTDAEFKNAMGGVFGDRLKACL